MTLECDKNKYSNESTYFSGFYKKKTINQYETLHRLNLGLGTKNKYRAKSIRFRSGEQCLSLDTCFTQIRSIVQEFKGM